MRALLAAAVAALAAGCLGSPSAELRAESAIDACRAAPLAEHVLHFGPSLSLLPEPQPDGATPGNSFVGAFLTDDLKEWLSAPVAEGLWLEGPVTLEFWARSTGSPAPVVVGGDPGEGYHFFNQFGSDRSLQPAYAVEYGEALPAAGSVQRFVETLELPAGGFVLERGDRVRVLLTDLALDGPQGGGHDILYGGATPSQVRFQARCWPDVRWTEGVLAEEPVALPANQGLLTGAVPAGPANRHEVQFVLPEGADRLTVTIRQGVDVNPVKDDIDVTLLDRAGQPVWSIGSPYSGESGTLWRDNLRAAFPDGAVTVRVDSYSGVAYEGTLTVAAAHALAD